MMRLNLPNFGEVNQGGIPPWMRGAEFGMNMLGKGNDLLTQALQQEKMQKEMPYIQKMKEQQLQQALLANKMNETRSRYLEPSLQQQIQRSILENQYLPQNMESQIAARLANTERMKQMTPLEAEKLKQQNKYYPELTQSQIDLNRMGGKSGFGKDQKEELLFNSLIAKDNPHIANDPEKLYEANNVISEGGNRLSDGTPVQLSATSRRSLDRLLKGTTTGAVATQMINSAQAESELGTLSNIASEWAAPYQNTIMGKSPKQIVDTFKSDDKSQDELGKFIASQMLQYDIAQHQIRLSMGKPGITTTQELLNMGQQVIKTAYPMLSSKARQAALKYFNEAVKQGFESRKKVGLGLSGVMGNKKISQAVGNKKYDFSKMSDEELEAMVGG